jgi:hypothetical protein
MGWGNHRVFAFNPDGTQKWISTDVGSGHSGVTIGPDGTIYFSGYSGYFVGEALLVALNPDGSTKWAYPGASCWNTATVGPDGTIYIGTGSFLYAVSDNGTAGIIKWSYPGSFGSTAAGGSTAAIGNDGTIYAGANDKKLYAFDPNGTLKWSYETGSSFGWGLVSIDGGGTIYVQPDAAKVYALGSNGTFKWSYDPGGTGAETNDVAIGNGVLYICGGSTQKRLIALQPWTLSATTTSIPSGGGMTITATTSMLRADPSNPGENNQVQAVMHNGDKVALSYSSTNANGETVWTGTWGAPAGTPSGVYTATIEAAAYNIQTDRGVQFASAPTGSNNTGITNTFSYSGTLKQQVSVATGAGTATFTGNNGAITGLTSMPLSAVTYSCPTNISFPCGLFSFNIINIIPGSTVTITITLPIPCTQYWKYTPSGWIQIPVISALDNVMTIQLTDGGLGDADGVANGVIVDPGGPGLSGGGAAAEGAAEGASAGESHATTQSSPHLNVAYLNVSPTQTKVNQPVTISANVVNDGTETGSTQVALKINGQIEQTKVVTVGGGSSRPVKFTVTKAEPGTYTVIMGSQRASFVVTEGGATSAPALSDGVIAMLLAGLVVVAFVIILAFAFRRKSY